MIIISISLISNGNEVFLDLRLKTLLVELRLFDVSKTQVELQMGSEVLQQFGIVALLVHFD